MKVDQSHVVLDHPSDLTHYVKEAIDRSIADHRDLHKIIVFFNNTGLVKAMYKYFEKDRMFKRSNVQETILIQTFKPSSSHFQFLKQM